MKRPRRTNPPECKPQRYPDTRERVWDRVLGTFVPARPTVAEVIAQIEAEIADPKPEYESKPPPPLGSARPEQFDECEDELRRGDTEEGDDL